MTLAGGADAKVGSADGAQYVNLFEAAAPEPTEVAEGAPPPETEAAPLEPEPARANPVPASGVVRMDTKMANGQAVLSFAWANPNGAAVFRRGGAIWVVFDAPATIDVSKSPRGLRQFSKVTAYKGADYSAVRIDAAPGVPVFATSQGPVWSIALGAGAQGQSSQIKITRDTAGGPASLNAGEPGRRPHCWRHPVCDHRSGPLQGRRCPP